MTSAQTFLARASIRPLLEAMLEGRGQARKQRLVGLLGPDHVSLLFELGHPAAKPLRLGTQSADGKGDATAAA